MPLQTDALVTLDQMRDFLNQDLEDRAREVERYINSATTVVQKFTHRKLKARDYTDIIVDGSGAHRLLAREWPINTLTKMEFLIQTHPDAWELQDLTEFVIVQPERQLIERRGCRFPRMTQGVRLTMNAGYATLEQDLIDATCMVVKHLMNMPDYQYTSIQSVTENGQTTVYRHDAIPPQALPTLKAYRRKEV